MESIIFLGSGDLTGYRKEVYDLCCKKMGAELSEKDKEVLRWQCSFMARPTAKLYQQMDWEDMGAREGFLEILAAYSEDGLRNTEGVEVDGIVFTYEKGFDVDAHLGAFKDLAAWTLAHPEDGRAQDEYYAYLSEAGELRIY